MDEQPVQLVKETRKPIAATAKHARRVDYEYERAGTASIFMFTTHTNATFYEAFKPSQKCRMSVGLNFR